MNRPPPNLFALLTVCCCAVMYGITIPSIEGWYKWNKISKAQSWPTTEAKILSWTPTSGMKTASVKTSFIYTYKGRKYKSYDYSIAGGFFGYSIVSKQLAVGDNVMVHVNPDKNGQAYINIDKGRVPQQAIYFSLAWLAFLSCGIYFYRLYIKAAC